MSLLKYLMIALAALAACGIVRAEMSGFVPATDRPARNSALVDSSVYSFSEIANLPAGAEHRLLTGETSRNVSEMTLAELSSAAHARSVPSASARVAGAPMGSVLTLNSSEDAAVEDFSGSAKGTDTQAKASNLFSMSEIPEPGDWMTLLCGLVVVGFMARRKR